MKLKVKTQDDRLYMVDVNPSAQIREVKAEVQRMDASVVANKYRILFQGRFLEDDSVVQSVGMEDGHTVLIVPKPPTSRGLQRDASSSESVYYGERKQRRLCGHVDNASANRTHPSLRRFPPEVLRFLQAQQTVFAMIQAQRGEGRTGTGDEELDAMESQPVFDNVVDVRECDSSDLLLGFVVGFLLGPIAGLCLIENALSRNLRAGMLMGIICEVVVALFKMATHIPKGV